MSVRRTVLSAHDVTKSFGGLDVLQGVTLEVAAGSRHALIGPNGAGKTTLLNILSGLLRPSSGAIRFQDDDVTRYPSHRRARRGLGRTFQVASLFDELTVADNVRLALLARERLALRFYVPSQVRAALSEEAAALLEDWGLGDRSLVPVNELSYGEKRIVEVIMAAAGRPSVVLLDEPAAGLSASETTRMIEALSHLGPNTAVLLVEHDMDVVFKVCDHVTVLAEGRFLVEGTPSEIRTSQVVRDAYLGASL